MKKPTSENIQESSAVAQDAAANKVPESQEWAPEISPELAGMRPGAETAANIDAPQEMPKKSDVEAAAELAKDLGQLVSTTIEGITGRDYGLTEPAVTKWAEGVAPLLVKYGLTDMGTLMGRYGAEIQAGIATLMLGAGCYMAHRKYKAEDAEKAEQEKLKEAA